MLWIALAVMTGLAMGFILWPLGFRARERTPESREADFYRAQLDEIARDVERGQLPPEEAASARTEAARRLIAASDNPTQAKPAGALWRRRAAAVAVFVVVPVVALGVYGWVGQPDLPDEPLSARRMDLNAPGAIDAAVAKIEAHLLQTPDDLRGWQVLAPVYMRMGRFPDAVGAYRQAIRLGDDTQQTRAALGEAMVAMADGVVTAEARAEFDKAADSPKAKFYLALAAEQDGKTDEAKKAYEALAPLAKGEAPWMQGLRAHLAALNGGAAPQAAAPVFSPDQRKMIDGMVQKLADRLAKQGGNAEEWGRLIRAYSVLHEPDKAREALASARKALGANADIDALARELPAAPNAAPAAPQAAAPVFSPDQRKMIEGMVQKLADRLAKQGGNAEEWGRLIRAYSVLQEPDKAREALASARKALGANTDIDALARELRL